MWRIKDALRDLAERQWAWVEARGWHNKNSPLEYLALIASEVGEAVNECRGEKVSENFPFELADIILRVVDMAEQYGFDIGHYVVEKMELNKKRENIKASGKKVK